MGECERNKHAFLFLGVCFLGFMFGSSCGDTHPSDAAALREMYSFLNSPSQLTQWSSSGNDPCGQSWKGISCSGDRVTEIKVPGLQLSGSLGFQLSSLTFLTNLDVSNNNLGGQLSYQLPPNAQRLNFANNNFNQEPPWSISQMTNLKYLNLAHNQFQGLPDLFGQLTNLVTLDLSSNQISGNLPQSFSSLSNIQTMNLQNNQFTGDINALANLPLRNLNLENNHFTGWIPDSLRNINIQKGGNSWSSGAAPPPPPGTPPAWKHRHDRGGGNSPSESSGGKQSRVSGGGVAGIIISLFIIGVIIAFFAVKKRRFRKRSLCDAEKPNNQTLAPLTAPGFHEMKSVLPTPIINVKSFDSSDSFNLKPPPVDRHKSFDEEEFVVKPIVIKKAIVPPTNVSLYSVADLQMATGSFSEDNLLGEGSFGRVYRAQFEDGMVFAIKKIDSLALPSDRSDDFLEMVSIVSRINHPNITELRGCCAEHGQHLLLYEFQKIGSLFDFMHLPDEYSKPLTWNSRVKIALGTARALEYLHEVCSPSIVHKNIKSANILLDLELNPHVSDCGLASFLPNAEQILNQETGLGYSAPEVSMTGQYSLNSDVYSFGVVMLELLTGRKPFDKSRQRSEQSLVRWATPQLHDIDALSRMVDPALKGLYPVKSLSRFADVIALSVQGEPEFRPPMSEVVQALVRLVQRANMSKRTFSGDQRGSQQSDEGDTLEKIS